MSRTFYYTLYCGVIKKIIILKFVLILDNASIHRSKKDQKFVDFHILAV